MSSYRRQTRHPITGSWENALWVDDLFGRHHYGVVFPSDERDELTYEAIAYDAEKAILLTMARNSYVDDR